MGKTKRGGKGAGYEYWSRRPTKGGAYTSPGKENKVKTHRLERKKSRLDIQINDDRDLSQ